jgi:hypothetical protein
MLETFVVELVTRTCHWEIPRSIVLEDASERCLCWNLDEDVITQGRYQEIPLSLMFN